MLRTRRRGSTYASGSRLAIVAVAALALRVNACRFGYDFSSVDVDTSGRTGSGGASMGGTSSQGASGAGGGGAAGGAAVQVGGNSTGGTVGKGGVGGTRSSGGGGLGSTGGGDGGANDAGFGGASSAGEGGLGGTSGGGSAGTTAGGASAPSGGVGGANDGGLGGVSDGGLGGAAAAGTGGGGPPTNHVSEGYWLLDASDQGGQNWTSSTLLVTSSSQNPDGTFALTYRVDWFEDAGSFGILLGGEEFGVGSYDPAVNRLVLDQTGGWSADELDHYEAEYDPSSDDLIDGFWDTGNLGTFTGVRRLSGALLPLSGASATSTRNMLRASNAIDTDMVSYWSSTNGATVGEALTLTLQTPAPLRGLRIFSYPYSNEAAPSRVLVTSRDGDGNELDSSDVTMNDDSMWRAGTFSVLAPVAEVEIRFTEVQPANASRVVISGVELFGVP